MLIFDSFPANQVIRFVDFNVKMTAIPPLNNQIENDHEVCQYGKIYDDMATKK